MSTAQLGRAGHRFKRGNRHIRLGNSGLATAGLQISTSVIDNAVIGTPYDQQMVATGAVGTKSWSSTDLPPGLTINGVSGLITGDPGTPTGTYTPEIFVTDGVTVAHRLYTMTVSASSGTLSITTASLGQARISENYSKQMTASNVVGTASWSMTVSGGTAHNLVINANTGRITATPFGGTSTADRTVVVTVGDDSGNPAVFRSYTLTVIEAPVEIVDTGFPEAEVGVAYSHQLTKTGGAGAISWKAGTILNPDSPNWPEGISMNSSGLITGTPVAGTDGTTSQLVTVKDTTYVGVEEDTLGAGFVVNPKNTDPPGFVGYANRRIGFCKNAATEAQVRTLGTIIANGTDRLSGGLIRQDIDGRSLGGSNNLNMGEGPGTPGGTLDAISDTGAKCNALVGYSHRDDQRTLTFTGSTATSPNRVIWNGGVGTGLSSQAGVAGHRPFLPGDGMVFGGMTIHGPGIPTGGRKVTTGDYDYVGQIPGVDGMRSNAPTVSNVYLPLDGSVTAASGVYTIGGTGSVGDSKMAYRDPVDAEAVARAVTVQGGARVGSIELWNEVAWPLGQRPFTDVPLMCRIFAHQYVGVKKALKDAGRPWDAVRVIFAGTGMINDNTTYLGPGRNHFFNARQWYTKCLDFFIDDDPDYFTNLCTARGLTGAYAKDQAPKFPGDTLAMHPYGQSTLDPNNMGMNQCADVYNMVGARAGWLPLSLVEQGLAWNRTGIRTDNQGRPNLDRIVAHDRYVAWIDILHGNRPWPYTTKLNGPGQGTHLPTGNGTSGTITLTERRRKMRIVSDCPQWFAIREPFNAHAELGVAWDFDNNQKYVLGTVDPVQAMANVDITGL